jgi:hypothetical protein
MIHNRQNRCLGDSFSTTIILIEDDVKCRLYSKKFFNMSIGPATFYSKIIRRVVPADSRKIIHTFSTALITHHIQVGRSHCRPDIFSNCGLIPQILFCTVQFRPNFPTFPIKRFDSANGSIPFFNYNTFCFAFTPLSPRKLIIVVHWW